MSQQQPITALPDFRAARVLVAGDVMLDRYWHGDTGRISPEAPVPVVHVKNREDRPGGAGNVALNMQSLGAYSTLLGIVGKDEAGDILKHKFDAANIKHQLLVCTDMPTITKLRITSQNQQMLRCDFEEVFVDDRIQELEKQFVAALKNNHAVVLSDYGKGSLQNPQAMIHHANKAGVPVLTDPKGHDFSRYCGASLLTPNKKEFEMVVGRCHDENDLVAKGMQALEQYQLKALLITRGAQGMTLLQQGAPALHLPARAREVYDVTGAGDTVIAVMAAAMACGAPLESAARWANCAASIVVGRAGAASVTMPELRIAIQKHHGRDSTILSTAQCIDAIRDIKSTGASIVMTNGCFDILHAGHVQYLNEAKAQGTHLVVAVNDDASVTKLKGAGRPINNLARRMAVLAGLEAVDWVVDFAEDTPINLIHQIRPDVLVKGGDYDLSTIVGADFVQSYGGEVKALSFVDGMSTSDVISKVKAKEVLA